jgi:hypothetical protein
MPVLLFPLKCRNGLRGRAVEMIHRSFGQKKGHERRIFRLYGKKQTFVAQVVYVLPVRFKTA